MREGVEVLVDVEGARARGFAPELPRAPAACVLRVRKVDVRLPGKGNSKSHGARPVHLIIKMINLVRASTLSINNSLSATRER